jgi:hypothetical protein
MENDPNRYGPPPATKEAVEGLKRLKLEDFRNSVIECCVCLTKLADSLGESE